MLFRSFGWRAMLSGVHTAEDIERTVAGMERVIGLLRAEKLVP